MIELNCYIRESLSSAQTSADIKKLIPDAMLRRRISGITREAVSTGLECALLAGLPLDAIITATGWGCLAESEKFLKGFKESDEMSASPSAFMQSTFNSVGSYLAQVLHCHEYNMTYVNRGHSFEDAVLDAAMLIEDNEAANVLLGAYDELTPSQYGIMERMGFWRKYQSGAGAAFMVISKEKGRNCLARLSGMEFNCENMSEAGVAGRFNCNMDNGELIYIKYQMFPVASSIGFVQATDRILSGTGKVVIYNEFPGDRPVISILECI